MELRSNQVLREGRRPSTAEDGKWQLNEPEQKDVESKRDIVPTAAATSCQTRDTRHTNSHLSRAACFYNMRVL